MRHSAARLLFLVPFALGLIGCPTTDMCDQMASRCGGSDAANWARWCRGECVPEYARSVPCDANASCGLCDAPAADGSVSIFGLPPELEYLWTLTDEPAESAHPPTEPAPTGTAFVDGPETWAGNRMGSWEPYEPFPALHPLSRTGFCEPGPNRYIADNLVGTEGALVLRADRMIDSPEAPYCPGGRCPSGPYAECGAPAPGCQYGEAPEEMGLGSGAQATRGPGRPTYGYGTYRAVLKPAGDTVAPQPGFVYAFFTQDNTPCVGGEPDLEANTSEVDIEISSGPGDNDRYRFCNTNETCLQTTTWASSSQGIPRYQGVDRHQVSGFRFRDPSAANQFRTYGWNWEQDQVDFVYDSNPRDCDESTGACGPTNGSLAICRHVRFVPRRPSPLHLQLWNAWWAGDTARGTRAEMSVERLWHEPAPR